MVLERFTRGLVKFGNGIPNSRSFFNSLHGQVNVTLSYVNDEDYYIYEIDSRPTRLNENTSTR